MSSAYAASKVGHHCPDQDLGKELAREGILVNCTGAAAATVMMEQIDEHCRADILARIPMRRFIELMRSRR
jgi:3-oxoacyl-[acyl-carrier protein] reductase